jgi:DNA polymerase-3 subunit gamma/tau
MDAASNNGVDEHPRPAIDEANFTPAICQIPGVHHRRGAHAFSVSAFNALLKIMEEPPPHILIFILATTEVHKVPQTIVSRCQRYDFRRIASGGHRRAPRARLRAGARGDRSRRGDADCCHCGRRHARRALNSRPVHRPQHRRGQLCARGGDGGLAGRGHLEELALCIHRGDRSGALEKIDALYKASKDMGRLCEELAGYFRSLMLIKTMKDASGIVDAVGEEFDRMTKLAVSMDLSAILHGLDAFQSTLSRMKTGNKRTELEMTFIRLCSPELDTSPDALLRRIEALERGGGLRRAVQPVQNAEVSVPQAPPELAAKREEAPKTAQRSSAASIEELSSKAEPFDAWPEIIAIMKNYSHSVAAAFNGSSAYVNGEYMLIEAPQIAFDLLKRASQRDKMREAIQQVTGRVYKLGPYKPPAATADSGSKPQNTLDSFIRDMQDAGVEIEEK